MRISWIPLSLNPAARAYEEPPISKAVARVTPSSSRVLLSASEPASESVSLLSCMRNSWTVSPPCAAAIAYAAPPMRKASTP